MYSVCAICMISGWPVPNFNPLPHRRVFHPVALMLLQLSGSVLAVEIHVSSDRNPVPQDEAFTLTYSASETPDAEPDFSVLEQDFDLLSQSENRQVAFVDGQYRESREWVISLIPKKPGLLTVPKVAFGADHSDSLTVRVEGIPTNPQADERDVFIEVTADPPDPYVQAQSLYTVRIFSKTGFNGGELSEPVAEDMLIQRLGDDHRYTAQRQANRYDVIERHYALFPQKSGNLTIGGLTLTTRVPVRGGGAGINPFFGTRLTPKRLQSDPVTLAVRPIPQNGTGHHWLPATQVVLQESWSGQLDALTVGEPLTRTLTLTAQGATVGLLPELLPSASPSDPGGDIRRYADQPTLNEEKLASGVVSVRHEKIAYVPSRPGSVTVPPLTVHWWNTRTGQPEEARLPAHILTVQAATATAPSPASAQPAPVVTVPASTQAPITPGQSAPPPPAAATYPWKGLAVFFAVAWLVTLLVWWLTGRIRVNGPAQSATEPTPPDTRQALASLHKACMDNDARAARTALLAWVEARWPEDAPTGLEALTARADQPFRQAVESLNRVLYAEATSTHWQGAGLWEQVDRHERQSRRVKQTRPARQLEPLYPVT